MELRCVKESVLLLVLVLAGSCRRALQQEGEADVQLLLMLHLSATQQQEDNTTPPPVALWDRGQELLPAAQLAVQEINSSPKLLPECVLGLRVEDIEACVEDQFASNHKALVPFVKISNLTAKYSRVLGLVSGPFCPPLLTKLISPLASKRHTRLFKLSGSTAATVREHNLDLKFITPSIKLHYEAAYSLMAKLNWTSIVVIAESFFRGATAVAGSERLNITYRQFDSNLPSLLSDLRHSQKNVVFASVGGNQAADMLCEAERESLLYPHYVWIFHDLSPSLIASSRSQGCNLTRLEEALNGTLFLQFPFWPGSPNATLVSGKGYADYYSEYRSRLGDGLRPNPYANVVYDSVWAFALALNLSLASINCSLLTSAEDKQRLEPKQRLVDQMDQMLPQVSFQGASGSIDFGKEVVNDMVEICFHYDNSTTLVAVYQTSTNLSIRDEVLLSSLPEDTLSSEYVLIPLMLTVFLSVAIGICILLTTVILALFIHYREDPDIKAASPHLSYLMFLGCYLLFAATLLHIVSGATVVTGAGVFAICGAIIGGDSLGVNFIFTTLLLRLLRIYHIFSSFGKTGKMWSNRSMAAVVGVVIICDLALIIVWSCVDTFTFMDVVTFKPKARPPYYQVHQYCHSRHLSVWLGLVLGKLGVLFVAVIYLAIKTRKIRRSNFKDTKKVNIYIFSTMMVVIIHMTLFFLFKSTNNAIATHLMVYLAFSVTGLLCQLLLFVPKVTSPILRRCGYEVTYEKTRGKRVLSKRLQQNRQSRVTVMLATSHFTELI